jgi:hypothetical protein
MNKLDDHCFCSIVMQEPRQACKVRLQRFNIGSLLFLFARLFTLSIFDRSVSSYHCGLSICLSIDVFTRRFYSIVTYSLFVSSHSNWHWSLRLYFYRSQNVAMFAIGRSFSRSFSHRIDLGSQILCSVLRSRSTWKLSSTSFRASGFILVRCAHTSWLIDRRYSNLYFHRTSSLLSRKTNLYDLSMLRERKSICCA